MNYVYFGVVGILKFFVVCDLLILFIYVLVFYWFLLNMNLVFFWILIVMLNLVLCMWLFRLGLVFCLWKLILIKWCCIIFCMMLYSGWFWDKEVRLDICFIFL